MTKTDQHSSTTDDSAPGHPKFQSLYSAIKAVILHAEQSARTARERTTEDELEARTRENGAADGIGPSEAIG